MAHIGALTGSHTVELLMTHGWIKSSLCCKCNRSDAFTKKVSKLSGNQAASSEKVYWFTLHFSVLQCSAMSIPQYTWLKTYQMKEKQTLIRDENTSKQLCLEQFIQVVYCSSGSSGKACNQEKMMTKKPMGRRKIWLPASYT